MELSANTKTTLRITQEGYILLGQKAYELLGKPKHVNIELRNRRFVIIKRSSIGIPMNTEGSTELAVPSLCSRAGVYPVYISGTSLYVDIV